MIFNIPTGVIWPFEWFHLCFTCNKNTYNIVANGKIWDSKNISNNKNEDFNDRFIQQIAIGSRSTGEDVFHGRISGLNIWNHEMTIAELLAITSNCDKLQKQPNILNWSMINKNQITLAKNGAVKFVNADKEMCSLSNNSW